MKTSKKEAKQMVFFFPNSKQIERKRMPKTSKMMGGGAVFGRRFLSLGKSTKNCARRIKELKKDDNIKKRNTSINHRWSN